MIHWNENPIVLTNDNFYTKTVLRSLHENIRFLRHPMDTIALWSHHSKFLIVDQKTAFLGGFDVCFGRWDTPEHPIIEEPNELGLYHYPGLDYGNMRTCDLQNVQEYKKESIDRQSQVRNQWRIHGTRCRNEVR